MVSEPSKRKTQKVKKRCLKCGKIYTDVPAATWHLKYPDRIYRGLCEMCKNVNRQSHLNEEDFPGGVVVE